MGLRKTKLQENGESYIMLNYMYSAPNIIRSLKSRRLRWAGHVACMELSRNADRILVRKPEGKRPLGKPRRRCQDDTKMDLRGWIVMMET